MFIAVNLTTHADIPAIRKNFNDAAREQAGIARPHECTENIDDNGE